MNLTEPLTNDTEFVSYPSLDQSDNKIGSICGIDNLPLIGLTPMDDTMMNFKINPAVFEQYNLGSIETPCSTDFRFKNGDNYIQYKLHYSIGGVPKYVKVSTEPQVYNVTCKIADKFYVYNLSMTNPLTSAELLTTEGYSLLPYLSPTISIPDGSSAMGKKAISPCVECIELPEGVVFIPAYYFQSAPIKQITLPSTLQVIGYMSFGGCVELTSITLPNSLMGISHQAFMYCTNLTEIVIPDSVTEIGAWAFKGCTSLTSVTIGSGVTVLYDSAFKDCNNLTEIVCYATTAPRLSDEVFYNIPINGVLKVPSGSDYSSWLNRLPSGWTIENM